jgi:hypothetical protein
MIEMSIFALIAVNTNFEVLGRGRMGNGGADLTQRIAIILRIAEDRARDFETMFGEDELPIWDEYTSQGLFLEASLTRVEGGSENPGGDMGGGPDGVQDYILEVVVPDFAAHQRHDADPRFKAFLDKATRLHAMQPLVFFGTPVFERKTERSP